MERTSLESGPVAAVPDDRPQAPQRSVAHWVTGRRSKCLVMVVWLAALVVATGLAGKLSGVEKNDARSALPNSAESTHGYHAQGAVMSLDTIPAVVVYDRPRD